MPLHAHPFLPTACRQPSRALAHVLFYFNLLLLLQNDLELALVFHHLSRYAYIFLLVVIFLLQFEGSQLLLNITTVKED